MEEQAKIIKEIFENDLLIEKLNNPNLDLTYEYDSEANIYIEYKDIYFDLYVNTFDFYVDIKPESVKYYDDIFNIVNNFSFIKSCYVDVMKQHIGYIFIGGINYENFNETANGIKKILNII